ncbi:MAG: Serine-tRNA ligase [Candidatus Azambacteria bacterium GW2011_GWE1_42_9]|nr:MAG: Serine-tRNA ligase [Candidatus Azambacteria bacterium GW2011_GWF1_41_10]KKS49106.1 MAG: Serine-tRNA ligase [Candidatus Azambacteria bacterium GW2011_GWF2_42_22]KKS69813.1 MAG: Serine-tRNA ligase [Candidatus Azambacteria bacterium GW2011_GWA2_42_62]KKS74528.1 MAG: Serine-tRNA ligase [Candidatus Azambacteria bacterium GW2011_GWB1_42_72]KKS79129.1 MAG: Serine-tRNA ligase [Candidatus Azambacteria bacterium GW2011_GWE1_42_9]KKT03314.1 MAG: Serine-tRNA ligase [Candidatus Azambacteria bacteri
MLDTKFIRENKRIAETGIKAKGFDVDIGALLDLDGRRIVLRKKIETLNTERKNNADIKNAEKGRKLKSQLNAYEAEEKSLNESIELLRRKMPNLPLPEVPYGKDENDNIVLREMGEKTNFPFVPKDYLALNDELNWIDTERAGKAIGSRFGYLLRDAVNLEFALVRFAFGILQKEGFIPIVPPVFLKPEAMRGMGYLDYNEDEVYHLEKDDLYLIGTSEQAIGAMHMNEIFTEKELPLRYAGFSSCFRREAGSYGKDTKGILRVHQFDKIELFSFVKPENSKEEHEFLLGLEEKLMRSLNLPYRVLQICTGDLGVQAANKYDIETWLPGQNQYRETHSTSNDTDFQSRRLNIKYKNEATGKNELVYTLNGTAFAVGRILIAIMENYQQEDGTIKIPDALKPLL